MYFEPGLPNLYHLWAKTCQVSILTGHRSVANHATGVGALKYNVVSRRDQEGGTLKCNVVSRRDQENALCGVVLLLLFFFFRIKGCVYMQRIKGSKIGYFQQKGSYSKPCNTF